MGSSDHGCVSAGHQWGQQDWGRGGPQVSHQGLSTREGKSEVSGLRSISGCLPEAQAHLLTP